nr:MAG TPA: hypothetical protein [Caudoviricetes sp.]
MSTRSDHIGDPEPFYVLLGTRPERKTFRITVREYNETNGLYRNLRLP